MTLGLAIVFASFWSLTAVTAVKTDRFQSRTLKAWLIDAACLLIQGLLIPVVQTLLIAQLWSVLFPEAKESWQMPWAMAFALSFVVVDYLYYWNHRLLHTPILWKWHKLHHSTQTLDLVASSRNSLLTPALIVYVWANSLFLFLLGDATPFIVASSIGAALDLWRHSGLNVSETSLVYRLLSPWLILPQDHEAHHRVETHGVNYGANFKIWDKWHDTYEAPARMLQQKPTTQATMANHANEDLKWSQFFWPTDSQAAATQETKVSE